MTWWQWVVALGGGFLVVSLVVSLAIAATLGRISREVSELLETDSWTSAPLARSVRDAEAEALRDEEPAEPRRGETRRRSLHRTR